MTYVPASLRQAVIERASGCCEYCRLSQDDHFLAHEIDHIIAEKHHGQTVSDNLCLSCFDCNRHKGSDVASVDPTTGEVVRLFHPRQDNWADHFTLDGAHIVPASPIGRVTVQLLQMNDSAQVAKRMELIETGRYPCNAS